MKKKSNREKGLETCRKLKRMLEAAGAVVEGPGYKPLFIPAQGKMTVVHKDYFGAYDLLVLSPAGISGVQVTSDPGKRDEKSDHIIGLGVVSYIAYPEGKTFEFLRVGPKSSDEMMFEEFLVDLQIGTRK